MKCSHCGKHNSNSAITCKRCGAALVPPAPAAPAASNPVTNAAAYNFSAASVAGVSDNAIRAVEKKRRVKAWIGAIAAVLAAALIAFIIFRLADSAGEYIPGSNSFTVLNESNGTEILRKGAAVLPEINKAEAHADASASVLGVKDVKGALYCLRGSNSASIAENVSDFAVSANGKCIVYTDNDCRLWAYSTSKKNAAPVCICGEAIMSDYVVSPDGKYAAYNKASDGALYLCSIANGKETRLNDKLIPVAVASGAKAIYAYGEDDCSLYLLNKRGVSAHMRGGIGAAVWLNYDNSQIAFTTLAANGNVKTMVYSGGREYEVAPAYVAPLMTVSMRAPMHSAESFTVITCPFKSFDGRLFTGDGIVRFTFGGAEQISSAAITKAGLSDDCKQLYYISDGALYHASSADFSSCEKVYDDCKSFFLANNGRTIWFEDGASALYCRAGSSPVKAADYFEAAQVSPNGEKLLFLQDGKVWYCTSGSPANAKCLEQSARAIALDRYGMYIFNGVSWRGIDRRGRLSELAE